MSGALRTCVLATRSRGKLRELLPMLRAHGWTPLTLDEAGVSYDPAEEHIEVHDTFEGNALAKARYYAARAGCYEHRLAAAVSHGAIWSIPELWANATEEHIKFSFADGITTTESVRASGVGNAQATLRCFGESLTFDATAAIE